MTNLDFLAVDFDSLCRSVGVIGFLTYMAAFTALQMEWLDGHGLSYSALNVIAAALVLVGLAVDFNLASALIQVSWIGIGLTGMAVRMRTRSTR